MKPGFWWLSAMSALAITTVVVDRAIKIDAFAGLRGQPSGLDPIAVRIPNAVIRHWSAGVLTDQATVDEVDLHRDYQGLELHGIRQGWSKQSRGVFNFTAKRAVWNPNQGEMNVYEQANVTGKNFSLMTLGFNYRKSTETLEIPNQVTGEFDGGKVSLNHLVYHLHDDSYATDAIEWQGKPSQITKELPQTDAASHIWRFKADHSQSNGKTTIYKNAFASDGSIAIQCPLISRDIATDVLTCTGPVKYFSPKSDVVCDHAVIDRKAKMAILTGNVNMVIKPKDQEALTITDVVPPYRPQVPESISESRPPAPLAEDSAGKKLDDELRSNASVRKYPALMRADRIDYWYGDGYKHAIITGSPQAQQELPGGRWRMVWADHAAYDGEKDELTLLSSEGKSDVRVKNSIGDDDVCQRFVTSTKDGVDDYSADMLQGVGPSTDPELNQAATDAGKKDKKGP